MRQSKSRQYITTGGCMPEGAMITMPKSSKIFRTQALAVATQSTKRSEKGQLEWRFVPPGRLRASAHDLTLSRTIESSPVSTKKKKKNVLIYKSQIENLNVSCFVMTR